MRAQLRAENPTHYPDDPYKLEQIYSAALFVLSCDKGDVMEDFNKEDRLAVNLDVSNLKQFMEPTTSKFIN